MAFMELASFSSQARGIKFYDVATTDINVGDHLIFLQETDNLWDMNCICLMISQAAGLKTLGHLAREAASYLSPLISAGFQATGLVKVSRNKLS